MSRIIKSFLKTYVDDAYECELNYNVPVYATLAQAALESGFGKHAPDFNFFGIKAGNSWKGSKQRLKTWEVIKGIRTPVYAYFRAYSSAYQGFVDHAKFLQRAFPKAFNHKDPMEFLISLQTEHIWNNGKPKVYATDPKYIEKMEKIYKMFDKELPF